jgi:N-acetyl-alpha-D-glucosaminyl L-malate synthase BshA
MRIGIVCYPTYGGSGAVATELGLALAQRGHDIHFISYAQPFRLKGFHENVAYHEVKIGAYPLFEHPPYSLALAVMLHEVAVKHGLEVIHAHYAIPHATSALEAKQLLSDDRPIAVVTTLHGTDITLVGQDPSYYTITKYSIEHSDAVTAVSAYLREETFRSFGCDTCQIEVIPNFVDLAEFHPPAPGTCGHGAKEKTLMHISNMRPVKRMTDVVRIFAKVREQVPARLVLVGDGPDRPVAEREADAMGVGRHVRFLGKVEDVAEALRWADLYLLPTQSESFGLSALEAMATGVPVIGAMAGGLPEVVEHGVSGFLGPAGDVDAMAGGAVELLRDPARWRAASVAARERAKAFATERVVPQYEQLYAAVVDAQ